MSVYIRKMTQQRADEILRIADDIIRRFIFFLYNGGLSSYRVY